MKTIGLLGGMSWESSALYYSFINEQVREQLGGLHSAKIVLVSVDFAEIEELQRCGEWDKAGELLGQAAAQLEEGGADFILICTNTMHKVFGSIQDSVKIPVLHIADATAAAITKSGLEKVGLLGTSYTMEQSFYKDRIAESGIDILVPGKKERNFINKVIFEELCLGKVRAPSRDAFNRIMEDLRLQGAEGIILGCTEIGMLVGGKDIDLPLFDTTKIHAQEAVNISLEND
ncbi:aspartate/glutamate racemase family protein [Bacillus sp. 1P06AnD]|uniref:aspartate/glutamate racemase family protein n=1 Tax=Bacillus sp. 1P06AnD TaxID=3132208 RepID=UPI00399F58D9